MRLNRILLPLLAALLPAGPLDAQQCLREYWHALEAAATLQQVSAAPVSCTGEPARTLAEGLAYFRTYEIGRDRTNAFLAHRILERAVQRQPTSAWARFALGVMLARGPDVRAVLGDDPSLYVVWGKPRSNAGNRAPEELQRALQLDSTLHEAAHAYAALALDFGDAAMMRIAAQQLGSASHAADARSQEMLALVRARGGDRAGALAAIEQFQSTGGDESLAAWLRGSALLRARATEDAGAAAYLEGLENLTPDAAGRYISDIAAVAPASTLQRIRSAPLARRGELLRRYWEMEAALNGVRVAARLGEHHRRMAALLLREGRIALMGDNAAISGMGGDIADVRELGVASAGALLQLRHGDAGRMQRVLSCGVGVLELPPALQPNASDCRVRAAMRNLDVREAQNQRPRGWDYSFATEMLPVPTGYERQAMARAVEGSSYYPPFTTHLALAWELLQFRGTNGNTDVVAALSVPAPSARALAAFGTITARTALALIDTAQAAVVRRDTLASWPALPMLDGSMLLLHTQVSVAPATAHRFSLSLTNADETAGRIVTGDVSVQRFHTDSLTMSDVVIAARDGNPTLRRGDVALSIAPAREYRQDEEFVLYYELYGITSGSAYRTELDVQAVPDGIAARVRALFPGGRDVLRLAFDDVAPADGTDRIQELRTVALDGLLPGEYRLLVRITDSRGRTVTREKQIFIAQEQQ